MQTEYILRRGQAMKLLKESLQFSLSTRLSTSIILSTTYWPTVRTAALALQGPQELTPSLGLAKLTA